MLKTISLRIDSGLLAAVDAAERRPRSEIIREALEDWLRRRQLEAKIRRDRDGYEKRPVLPDEFGPILESQVWPR